ncbi:hypothetical protein FDB55_15545 [Clostridium botulinum]|uniref:Lysozyme n=1 Tax=Clostridium botulinum TaxID=1491 RepID=A0A6M0V3K8_CLOBO|nr:peptidoglycan-binding protein [Clostridium botulinum]MCS6112580.1 hypothetical protein [Clostridium botulinum]NFE13089.1 hypothetical protein [Clostridium botulinum]NFE61231.1 hypothetical protein [Clostridium botulinum]NFF87300.1 hypothetical protein [Clostridium botulinum]NFG11339.1 hypothetical protein [Clostridium botulinum]
MLLKKGSQGRNVKLLQNNLKILGYDPYSSDGIFGLNTYNALVSYQKDNNLIPDGIAGDETINKIINDIKEIQKALCSKGHDLVSDGLTGINTFNALLEFQKSNNISVDGIVGPITRSKLFSCDIGSTSTNTNFDISNSSKIYDISDEGINFIADYEQFYSNSYRGLDYQNETIGYGHVIKSYENFTTLTEKEAEVLLKKDLESFVYLVNDMVQGLSINQHQFDSLISFSYNCGANALKTSTLLRDIRKGAELDTIKNDFCMWSMCNGEKSLGLWRRRMDEFDIFAFGDYKRKYRNFQ